MSSFARLAAVLASCVVVPGLMACSSDPTAAAGAGSPAPASSSTAPFTAFGSGPGSDDSDPATDEANMPAPEPGAAPTVFLSYAGYDAAEGLQASGYVDGRVENGGTCTLTVTGDGGSASVSSPARADARTTVCGLLTIPRAEVTPGTWQATLSYRSAQASATSEATEVTVP